ncbi:MAG: hypothetical protein U9O53_04210 [archaeon]|nr:hypothetical protein [archaeon]
MADESMFTIIVGALVLIAGVIGLVSYFSGDDSGLDLGFDLSAIKAPTGNFLKGFFDSSTATVDFSARLVSSEYQHISFRFSEPVNSIILNYTMPNPLIFVNGMPFSSEANYVVLGGFEGVVIISEKISFDGKTSYVSFNEVDVNPETSVSVGVENISVDYLSILSMSDKSFALVDVYGVVNVSTESGDIVYQKTAGDMEIKSFDGDLRIEDKVIYLEGTGVLKENALKSPGI